MEKSDGNLKENCLNCLRGNSERNTDLTRSLARFTLPPKTLHPIRAYTHTLSHTSTHTRIIDKFIRPFCLFYDLPSKHPS